MLLGLFEVSKVCFMVAKGRDAHRSTLGNRRERGRPLSGGSRTGQGTWRGCGSRAGQKVGGQCLEETVTRGPPCPLPHRGCRMQGGEPGDSWGMQLENEETVPR